MRRAPKGGYDTPEKDGYRRWVYDNLLPFRSTPKAPEYGKIEGVLCMPSSECAEIRFALSRGLPLGELYAADDSRAVVATITRTFPGIWAKSGSVESVVSKLSALGIQLQAINLDYCFKLSPELLRSVHAVASEPAAKYAVIFVNLLRGREESFMSAILDSDEVEKVHQAVLANKEHFCWEGEFDPTTADIKRLLAVKKAAGSYWMKTHAYRSSNGQSFLTILLGPPGFGDRTDDVDMLDRPTPGSPPPPANAGETWSSYANRITPSQMERVHYICKHMRITHGYFFQAYVPKLK